MEPESPAPYPQVPATCPYLQPTPSNPHDPLQLPEDPCMTRFNVQKFYVLHTEWIYMLLMEHETKNNYFSEQYNLVGFYKRDGVCLLRGRGWVFKCDSG